jgi:hypothetical protein
MKKSIEFMTGCIMLILSSCQHDISEYATTTDGIMPKRLQPMEM